MPANPLAPRGRIGGIRRCSRTAPATGSHLRENAGCGECRSPHLHVCHRPGNPNRAEAKTKHPWRVQGGTVAGGLVKRADPAIVRANFEYMTSGYPRGAGHGMLLV